jgi:hypothetical protein
VDPTGETVSLATLTAIQRTEVIDGLNAFTGNTYGVDEQLNLILLEVGAASSATATDFLNGVIGDKKEYKVRSANNDSAVKLGRTTLGGDTVELDFADIGRLRTGRVNPASINAGAILVHELVHAAFSWEDPPDSQSARTTTGAVVDFVNTMRQERGLPTRGPAYAARYGFNWTLKMNFQNVKAGKPAKIYYVRFRNYGN